MQGSSDIRRYPYRNDGKNQRGSSYLGSGRGQGLSKSFAARIIICILNLIGFFKMGICINIPAAISINTYSCYLISLASRL